MVVRHWVRSKVRCWVWSVEIWVLSTGCSTLVLVLSWCWVGCWCRCRVSTPSVQHRCRCWCWVLVLSASVNTECSTPGPVLGLGVGVECWVLGVGVGVNTGCWGLFSTPKLNTSCNQAHFQHPLLLKKALAQHPTPRGWTPVGGQKFGVEIECWKIIFIFFKLRWWLISLKFLF